jgi:hypothetical protein
MRNLSSKWILQRKYCERSFWLDQSLDVSSLYFYLISMNFNLNQFFIERVVQVRSFFGIWYPVSTIFRKILT